MEPVSTALYWFTVWVPLLCVARHHVRESFTIFRSHGGRKEAVRSPHFLPSWWVRGVLRMRALAFSAKHTCAQVQGARCHAGGRDGGTRCPFFAILCGCNRLPGMSQSLASGSSLTEYWPKVRHNAVSFS